MIILNKDFVVQVKNPSTGRWKKVEDTESHTFGLARSRAEKQMKTDIQVVIKDSVYSEGNRLYSIAGCKKLGFTTLNYRVYNTKSKEFWNLTY